jgi:hypothetical protein
MPILTNGTSIGDYVNPVRKDGFLNPPSLPAAGRKKE